MRFPPVSRWIFVFIRKKTGEAGLFSQRVDNPRPCHSEEYPKGTCFAARSDVEIRNLFRQKPAKSAGFVRFGNGLPRQCEHWLAMTGFFDSLRRPAGDTSATLRRTTQCEHWLGMTGKGQCAADPS